MNKEQTNKVIIQDIEFNLDGLKGFKKADFVNTWKEKKIKKGKDGKDIGKVKGVIGRFDPEKAFEEIQAKLKK